MKKNDLQKTHEDIIYCLQDKELLEALMKMDELAESADDPNAQADLEEMRTTYSYLLNYYEQGVDDPQRLQILDELTNKALKLSGRLLRSAEAHDAQQFGWQLADYYWQCTRKRKGRSLGDYQRALESHAENLALMQLTSANALQTDTELDKLRSNHERMAQEMFTDVWTSDFWRPEELAEARSLLQSAMVPTGDIALLVSAVTLALLETFDAQKFLFLTDAYRHEDPIVNQRALLGIVVVYFIDCWEISLTPEVQDRIKTLKEDDRFGEEVAMLQTEMLLTREIDKVKDKLENGIYPILVQDMMDMADNPENASFDNMFSSDNRNGGKKRNLTMGEFHKVIDEGVDIHYCNFSHAKAFSFFNEMSNWFLPYDPSHSMVANIVKQHKDLAALAKDIQHSPMVCESDKYSFVAVAAKMPEQLRKVAIQQSVLVRMPLKEESDRRFYARRHAVQDYYRFFKLFPYHDDFVDIFGLPYTTEGCSVVRAFSNKRMPLLMLGDYLFGKKLWNEAIPFYSHVLDSDGTDVASLEKLGLCYQEEKMYSSAISCFSKAELLDANNLLINDSLAFCYMQKEEYTKAIEYYEQLLQKEPNDIEYLEKTAQCYEYSDQYQKALDVVYKILYLDENNKDALTCAAWYNLECKQMEKAEMYYDRLLEVHGDVVCDYQYARAGLVAWILRKYKKAVSLFVTASKWSNNVESFISNEIETYKPELLEGGISEEEFPLMYDTIRLKFKEGKEEEPKEKKKAKKG